VQALHTFLRFYPFIGLALMLGLIEIGRHFRRLRDSRQWLFFLPAGFVFVTIMIWIFFRGDIHSDQWLKSLFGT